MSALSPALESALAGRSPTIFGAIRITLPHHTIRLLAGSGIVTFGGETFTGRDEIYGVLFAIEDLTDGVGGEAPALGITLAPASDAAATDLAGPDMQGSPVSVWLGAVDAGTGQPIGDPLLIFGGALDVPTLRASKAGRLLDLECSSSFENFFLSDDGCRLADRFHRSVWPGETGLSFVTGITQQIYWGAVAPSGVSGGMTGGAGSFLNTGSASSGVWAN